MPDSHGDRNVLDIAWQNCTRLPLLLTLSVAGHDVSAWHMASSIYLPIPQRGSGHRDKGRLSPALPSYSTAVHEKLGHRHSHSLPWTTPVTLPIPGVRTRRLRILVPNAARFHQFCVTRFGRKKGPAIMCMTIFTLVFTVFALAKRFAMEDKKWPSTSFGTPPTLVFGREELQRIWKWEIESGHYPSSQKRMRTPSHIIHRV